MPHTRQTALDDLARIRACYADTATGDVPVDIATIDALIATPDPRDLDAVRDELIGQLIDETRARAEAVAADAIGETSNRTRWIAHLASAVAALPSPPMLLEEPTPAINVERLAADVWNATQEAGYPTMYGDAAVAAIRHVLEGAALVPYRLGVPG